MGILPPEKQIQDKAVVAPAAKKLNHAYIGVSNVDAPAEEEKTKFPVIPPEKGAKPPKGDPLARVN